VIASTSMMITWQKSLGGRLKSDPSFSNAIVWNTFPLRALSDAETWPPCTRWPGSRALPVWELCAPAGSPYPFGNARAASQPLSHSTSSAGTSGSYDALRRSSSSTMRSARCKDSSLASEVPMG